MSDANKRISILVILVAGIGDFTLALKSIRAIRDGHPDAEIHLLVNSVASELAGNLDFVDKTWSFPIREMRKTKRTLLSILALVNRLRKVRFDMVVNLYRIASPWGAFKMGALCLLIRGKTNVGHAAMGFQTVLQVKIPKDAYVNRHIAEGMAEIARGAGGRFDHSRMSLKHSPASEQRWRSIFTSRGKHQNNQLFIGINPGGDRKEKRWRPDLYAALADKLMDRFDAEILILGGPGEEPIADAIQKEMASRATNLAGRLSLNDLVFIAGKLDLLVTNDSGPMHIAAATKTPLVVIFGTGDPKMFGPCAEKERYRIIFRKAPHSEDARLRNRRYRDRYIDWISVEEVFVECQMMIQNSPKPVQGKQSFL